MQNEIEIEEDIVVDWTALIDSARKLVELSIVIREDESENG